MDSYIIAPSLVFLNGSSYETRTNRQKISRFARNDRKRDCFVAMLIAMKWAGFKPAPTAMARNLFEYY